MTIRFALWYDALAQLAPGKEVKTAREPDGRLYGPAIFRVYHRETGHGPHYDSVAKRTKAFDYQISRFKHQFAGVLCFQNSTKEGGTGEPYLYNCPFRPELTEHLGREEFASYVAREGIERVQVQKLEPGDLYFFFSENVHEVPAVVGDQPRGGVGHLLCHVPRRRRDLRLVLKHPHHGPALSRQPFFDRLLGHRILRPLFGCHVRQPQQQSR